MAAVTGVFGKSIVAIRAAGALCLLGAVWWTFRSGERLWNRTTGFLAACFTVIYVTRAPSGGIVMSELVALPGLMLATSLVLKLDYRKRDLFFAGVGVSVASLMRMNLAYAAVAAGLFLTCRLVKLRGLRNSAAPLGMYVAGGLLPLVLIVLPYLFTGQLKLFIDSVFLAPLSYVSARKSPFEAALKILGSFRNKESIPLLLGFIAALGLWCRPSSFSGRRASSDETWRLVALSLIGFSTAWSIAGSGGGFGHYIIQGIPFFALPAARFYVALWSGRHRAVQAVGWLLIIFILYFPTEKIWKKYPIKSTKSREQKVAEYIGPRNPDKLPVYLMSSHGAHWYLGTPPIAKIVTHPTNITKVDLFPFVLEPGATPTGELRKIFAKKPVFIVVGRKTNLKSHRSTEGLFQRTIKKHYHKVWKSGGENIYMRNDYTPPNKRLSQKRLSQKRPSQKRLSK
jgi:hypothetical protein